MTDSSAPNPQPSSSRRFAFLVAAGIFLSRVAGLIRGRVFAHFFGDSDVADAFNAALRIPNFLQNLFGEGVLSASFIPVYAACLHAAIRKKRATRAGAVAAMLTLAFCACRRRCSRRSLVD